MKKLLLVALAVLLAVPAISNAGAVNNKWDMTIGGYVAMTAAWVNQDNQNAAAGFKNATREGLTADRTDNMTWNSEGRLNFVIKGPDTLGAKSSGRLEFDFLGSNLASAGTGATASTVTVGGTNSYMQIRHAYLQLDWANDTLLVGNTWYGWMATIPAGGFTLASLPNAAVPSRAQQIRWDHRFGKNVKASFGVESPQGGNWMNGVSNAHTYSLIPDVFGVVEYKSDACGRIGPNSLLIGASGVYGREKIRRGADVDTSFRQEDIWGGAAYAYIPIIPARQNNNTGAFGLSIGGMAGQGVSKYMPILPDYSLAYHTNGNLSRQRAYGWWGLAEVYVAHTVKFAFAYTDQSATTSRAFRQLAANANLVDRTQLFNVALFYDPSPAVRFGAEAGKIVTTFNRRALPNHHDANLNMFRLFAGYYF